MATYDSTSAECLVFTFKEGLLSAIAHDLKIRVTKFRIDIDEAGRAISAEFDAASLRVINAVKNGAEDPSALSDGDKSKIGGQIIDDVLHAKEHPAIRFTSTSVTRREDGGYDIAGTLDLHGVTKEVRATSRAEGGRQIAEVTIHQPDFGIKPYKAMMGTLKVQADVRVQVTV